MLNGYFFSCLKARNLLWKSYLKNGRGPEINHRNLDGNIIFNQNPKQNALEYLAFGVNFIMGIALQARNLNENLNENH
ncbi:hypothetical protein CIK90_08510 [Prevotella sp. P5-126]|nr:hypothetical protein CIK90_08510 [Prevotella sp. P5-126]